MATATSQPGLGSATPNPECVEVPQKLAAWLKAGARDTCQLQLTHLSNQAGGDVVFAALPLKLARGVLVGGGQLFRSSARWGVSTDPADGAVFHSQAHPFDPRQASPVQVRLAP